jgi:integrase
MVYYPGLSVFPPLRTLLALPEIDESKGNSYHVVVLRISALYACRIGELLRARVCDCIAGDRVVLSGEKGSRGRVLWLPRLGESLIGLPESAKEWCLFPYAYASIWRTAVRIGIDYKALGNINSSPTHAGRYRLANLIFEKQGREGVRDALGHQTSKTAEYYVPQIGE